MRKKIEVSLRCVNCGAKSVYIHGVMDTADPQSFKALDDQVGEQVPAPCGCGTVHLLQELHLDGELVESLSLMDASEKYDEQGRRAQKGVMDDLFGPFGYG